jgi:hypothetical protein
MWRGSNIWHEVEMTLMINLKADLIQKVYTDILLVLLYLNILPITIKIKYSQSFLSRNTNKMQPCIRIYYFKVYWRLNMFRAAYRSQSGALNCICSLWLIYICGERPLSRLSGNLQLLMMSGVPLETCWAFNKLWNNKFSYKFASCWLFLLIHTTMHGSMNIKLTNLSFWLLVG